MAKASQRLPLDRKRDLVVTKTIKIGDKVFSPGATDFDKKLVSDRRLRQLYDMKALAHVGEETLLVPAKVTPLPKRNQRPNSRSVVPEPKARIELKKERIFGAGTA